LYHRGAIGVARRCRAVVEDDVRSGGLDLLRLNLAVPDERRNFRQAGKTRPEEAFGRRSGRMGPPDHFLRRERVEEDSGRLAARHHPFDPIRDFYGTARCVDNGASRRRRHERQ
jgi:hypothetical protein